MHKRLSGVFMPNMWDDDDGNNIIKGWDFARDEQHAEEDSTRNNDSECSVELCQKDTSFELFYAN